jgi:tetratricopeptide (TPR) repeat protein
MIHKPRVLALLTLGLLWGASLAAPAQEQVTTGATQASLSVDESALRHFARQGDERRLRAEIARLSAIYPGWVPPADPLGNDDAIDTELQRIWDLYGEGDLTAVEAAVADRRERQPDWRPPQDLLAALVTGSAAAELRAAAAVQRHSEVIRTAAANPELLVCGNIDLLWSVAEAFAETGKQGRALDAYGYVLTSCEDTGERLATMQKASTLLSDNALESLFALERQGEFEPLRLDLARSAVADLLNGVRRRIDPEPIARLEAAVEIEPSVDDLLLLGYYELDQDRERKALEWFERAYEVEPTTAAVAGLALALARKRDYAEAEELLADYRFDTPELESQYLDVANQLLVGNPPRRLSQDVLERVIESIDEAEDANAAHNLGWYAFNYNQPQTAVRWFEEALEYDPAFEPAAYGLLVASQKLRDREAVRQIMREWGARSPRIELFGKPGAPTEAPLLMSDRNRSASVVEAVYQLDRPVHFQLVAELTAAQRRAAAQCGDYVPSEAFSPNAALGRAWCLMDLERSTEAEAAFRRATLSQSKDVRTEAYYGQTLALLRLGLIEDAAVAAAAMPQSQERVYELQTAILSSTATAYFDIGRYDEVLQLLDQRAMLAPERNDLLTIRAWSYYHLGRLREARQIFAAVAATGYQDAQRGLDAIAAKGF